MSRKLRKYFICSIVTAVTVCLVVFVLLGVSMARQTRQSITEISDVYMSEMNQQLQQKFNSITSLRLYQVDGLVKRIPPSTAIYGEDMLSELDTSAEVRSFTYLGLYSESGEEERIRGEKLNISNYDNLLFQLNEGGYDGTRRGQG